MPAAGLEPIEIVIGFLGVGATLVCGLCAVRFAMHSVREAKRQNEIALINAGHKSPSLEIAGVRKEPTLPQEPEPEIDPLLAQPDREVRGRDADIERIDAAFKDRGGLPAIAVTGPGGYGKTALAGEYARRRARRYRGVWLVDATSLGDTRNSLADLGVRLGIEVPLDAQQGIDCVLSALKATGGRWLLIHDNIDDPARLGELQHQLQHPDCVDHLMTGRVADWTGKAATVALDVLPEAEAEALLAAESGRDGEDGLAEMATGVLDCHPLALVVAGQTLRRV